MARPVAEAQGLELELLEEAHMHEAEVLPEPELLFPDINKKPTTRAPQPNRASMTVNIFFSTL